MKFLPCLFLSFLLFLASCEEKTSLEEVQEEATKFCPAKAYNIQDMGNSWATFQLDFGNRTDTYLICYYYNSKMCTKISESFTK